MLENIIDGMCLKVMMVLFNRWCSRLFDPRIGTTEVSVWLGSPLFMTEYRMGPQQ